MIQVPFHNKMSLAVHMDVPRMMIAFPRDQDIAAPTEFSHDKTLPHTVTHVNPVLHPVYAERPHRLAAAEPSAGVRCYGICSLNRRYQAAASSSNRWNIAL